MREDDTSRNRIYGLHTTTVRALLGVPVAVKVMGIAFGTATIPAGPIVELHAFGPPSYPEAGRRMRQSAQPDEQERTHP